jgi:acetyl esterase/lipase
MRAAVAAFSIFCVCSRLGAQAPVWQPAPGHTQVPLWPGAVPPARLDLGPETMTTTLSDHLVAGRPWTYIQNVSQPTLTVFSPRERKTGAAVIVFPGGGYQILAIDLEGTEVCDWLTARGVTCVLLKYRVPNGGPTWDQQCGCDRNSRSSAPLEDAQRAIRLVRYHASEWQINPQRVGVLGFSAGGHLVAALSTNYARRLYPPVDSADQASARPDFAVLLYPGHLYDPARRALNKQLRVTRETSPTFVLQAQNDSVDTVRNALTYYDALRNAGVPTELHLYTEGGHAFGLRRTRFPITAWPDLVERWLLTLGMLAP